MEFSLTRCPTCNRPLADLLCPVHGYVGPASPDDKNKLSGIQKNASSDICGEVRMFAGANAPNGWLLCQGQAVSRSDYSRLFSVIGTAYGTGDGSTTFNLPNFEGNVPVGMQHDDTDFHELGHSGGEKTHHLVADEMPAHTHTLTTYNGSVYNLGSGGLGITALTGSSSKTTSSAGGDGDHNNLQPYLCINFIIRT